MLSRIATRLRGRRAPSSTSEVAGLLRDLLGDVEVPLVALPSAADGLHQAVRAALPSAVVVVLPDDPTARHLLMARQGPFDAVVDEARPAGRAQRFSDTFWHLAPDRPYVVAGGAVELGPSPGRLGTMLRDAAVDAGQSLRGPRRSTHRSARVALANHVRHEARGDHLVLRHDLPDVLVKIREEECDEFLASSRHRVVEVVPDEEPPAAPPHREGPEPRDPPTDRPIERASLALRDYRDVVVAALQVVVDGRVLLPDSYRRNRSQWTWHKALAELAPRFAVPRGPIPPDVPTLPGTFVHLDNEARGHFGHLMTETLGRIWSWERALELDPDARVIVGGTPRRPEIAEWEYEFYAACGIPRDRIVLVDLGSPVRVERLVSGTPMWSQPHYVHPRIRETWEAVGDRLVATATPREDWPRRIFVSRRVVKRACVNGAELEAEFARAGFQVVFPEEYSLGDQVALFRNAEVVAGYGGSGMFQTLFALEPTHVIQVASETYGPRNEYLIAAVLGHRLDSVVCRAEPYDGAKQMHAPFRYDPEREGPLLRQILDGLPPLER